MTRDSALSQMDRIIGLFDVLSGAVSFNRSFSKEPTFTTDEYEQFKRTREALASLHRSIGEQTRSGEIPEGDE